jgi:hypothetical protein
VTPAAARRLADLVAAAWAIFDEVAAGSPAELRKGPRVGGRDRDQLIGHVIGVDTVYARKLGVTLKPPAMGDLAAIVNYARRSSASWAALRAARRWCPTAGPRVMRPAGSPGTSLNMLGRCRTGRRAQRAKDIQGKDRPCGGTSGGTRAHTTRVPGPPKRRAPP